MESVTLISIELVTDDPTPGAGTFDFLVPAERMDNFLRDPRNRAALSRELQKLAYKCQAGEHPFRIIK